MQDQFDHNQKGLDGCLNWLSMEVVGKVVGNSSAAPAGVGG